MVRPSGVIQRVTRRSNNPRTTKARTTLTGGGGSFEGERVGLADTDMPPRAAVSSGSLKASVFGGFGFADAKRTEVSRFKEPRDVIVSFGDR